MKGRGSTGRSIGRRPGSNRVAVARTAAVAAVLPAAACGSPFSTFGTSGPDADLIATISWFLIGLMAVLTLVMAALIILPVIRRRGSFAEHLPFDVGGGHAWILIGGFAVPVVIVSGLFLLTLITMPPASAGDVAAAPDLEIDITAHQWWWDVRYRGPEVQQWFTTANEIHIPVGKKVRVNLRSADVIHSFWVPKLDGKLDAIPGRTNHMIIEASEPGVYRGECAEYCGAQHTHMRFLVIAEPPGEYERWAARQREPAATPSTAQQRLGQQLFLGHACAYCHTVRGTDARGVVGPDITHIGSRRTIGAGTLPNNRAYLQGWIVNARSLKPGIIMPPMVMFDGEELNALATYLESLR